MECTIYKNYVAETNENHKNTTHYILGFLTDYL